MKSILGNRGSHHWSIHGPPHWIIACVVLCLGATAAHALKLNVDPPGDREFVRDLADMIDADAEQRIKELCDKLLTEKATPIIVVTIESMERYGGEDLRIETFATLLFNQWGIGHAELNGQDWNTGMLLLISRDDRKARIELGAGWGRREDATAKRIMDEMIIPQFKAGDFSKGIELGVDGLNNLARKLSLPTAPTPARPWWHYLLIVGFTLLAVFTGVSLYRRGASGWAWIFWAGLFTVVGMVLYQMLRNSGSGGSGGFSGGSFGGGSSGGGGASGSW